MPAKMRTRHVQCMQASLLPTEENGWTADLGKARDFYNTVNGGSQVHLNRIVGAKALIYFGAKPLRDAIVALYCDKLEG